MHIIISKLHLQWGSTRTLPRQLTAYNLRHLAWFRGALQQGKGRGRKQMEWRWKTPQNNFLATALAGKTQSLWATTDRFINVAVAVAQLYLTQQFFFHALCRKVHAVCHHVVFFAANHLWRIIISTYHHLRPVHQSHSLYRLAQRLHVHPYTQQHSKTNNKINQTTL